MRFVLNYNDGYEVGVVMMNEHGTVTTQPLRNFGERQGDAKIYQEVDCPKLSEPQIRMLVKLYDPEVKYKRVDGIRFVRQ